MMTDKITWQSCGLVVHFPRTPFTEWVRSWGWVLESVEFGGEALFASRLMGVLICAPFKNSPDTWWLYSTREKAMEDTRRENADQSGTFDSIPDVDRLA
jgi:hypothetical protein